jgi:sugar phosphate permease
MFLVEGVASLAMIFFWLPLIADRPEDAKWISKEEREFLTETINKEKGEINGLVKPAVSYTTLMADINLWKLTLIYFALQTGRLGFMLWLPTIVKNLTKMGIASVGLLSVGPYIAAIVGMYMFSAMSDKHLNRQRYTIITAGGFAIFFWLSTQFPAQVWLSYFLLIGTGFFTLSMLPVYWTMPPLLFSSGSAGAARGFINGLGGLGGFVGPFMFGWISTTFGISYGIYSLVFFLILGAAVCMTLPKITRGVQDMGFPANNAKV